MMSVWGNKEGYRNINCENIFNHHKICFILHRQTTFVFLGSLGGNWVAWGHGALGSRGLGVKGPWRHGALESRGFCALGTWGHWDLGSRGFGVKVSTTLNPFAVSAHISPLFKEW